MDMFFIKENLFHNDGYGDGYQILLVFSPILKSLKLDNGDKKVTSWTSAGLSPVRRQLFDFIFSPVLSNLSNGRVAEKVNIQSKQASKQAGK